MIEKISHIDLLKSLDLPLEEYVLVGGVWMSLIGIRPNKDLDLIATKKFKKLYKKRLKEIDSKLCKKVREIIDTSDVRAAKYIHLAKAKNAKSFVMNNFIKIDGFKIIPIDLLIQYKKHRHHVLRKHPRKMRGKDVKDLALIDQFFKDKNHLLPEYKGLFL